MNASPGAAPPEERPQTPLLEVRELHTHFAVRSGLLQRTTDSIRAVDGVSLHVRRGETLGLVGESGCGKTTVGRSILRLVPITSGEIRYDGRDVARMRGRELKRFRREAQVIFQDPEGSLNPRMRVGGIVGEPLLVHGKARGDELRRRVHELLDRVGLPSSAASRYPHEFSGGQRQRIGIARALALEPRFIICDEPTSALDVSIQSAILNLLRELREAFHLSYLFISHDMAVIHHLCDRIAVMFQGRIVESGERDEILYAPRHDYTKALLSAVPEAEPRRRKQRLVYSGMAT
jgi:ABC-type glutathione transport system ATPase component